MQKKRGRPRKYTARDFGEDTEKYFRSISYRTEDEDVLNLDGKPVVRLLYAEPPTISGLCAALGIDRQTWRNYEDEEKNPEFAEVCRGVRMRIEAYLERELLTREKSVQGIIFNLSNNYGWTEKRETANRVEVGLEDETRRAMQAMTIGEKFAAIRRAAADLDRIDERRAKER
ncbi:MAG: hypothetical protein IKQ92_02710 [Clostridia bacterium]|nr:hypothetical protein [Clostridia bacterium]